MGPLCEDLAMREAHFVSALISASVTIQASAVSAFDVLARTQGSCAPHRASSQAWRPKPRSAKERALRDGVSGQYDVIGFLAVLFGCAISGERTLEEFYERLQPFAVPFMALFERDRLPARSTLSRF